MKRKSFFSHVLNGVTLRMNRNGVVLRPTKPDPHLNLAGFGLLDFASPAERDAVHDAARQAGHTYRLTGHGWNVSELWTF